MELKSINQLPKGIEREGYAEDVYTEGFGHYYITIYTKGTRRYFELHGWYTGLCFFSTSIKDDRETALRMIREIADARVDRYRKNK